MSKEYTLNQCAIREIAETRKIPALTQALAALDRGDVDAAMHKIQLDWDKLSGTPGIEQAILDAELADGQFADYLHRRLRVLR